MSTPEVDDRRRERHLKLRQIEVFVEAARLSNFGAAAVALGISAAALSQAISDLERNLGEGVRLFERDQAGATLTPAGRALFTHGQELLRAEENVRQAVVGVETRAGREPTLFRIAYEPDFATIVADTVYALMGVNDFVTVRAHEAETEAVARMVEEGSVDLGLTYSSPQLSGALEASPVVAAPLCVVVSNRHHLRNATFVGLEELADERFAFAWLEEETPPGTARLRHHVEALFGKTGFTPRRVDFRTDSSASVLALVRTGAAVTLHTAPGIAKDQRFSVRPFRYKNTPSETVTLLRKKGAEESLEAQIFVKSLRHQQEQAAKLATVRRRTRMDGPPE